MTREPRTSTACDHPACTEAAVHPASAQVGDMTFRGAFCDQHFPNLTALGFRPVSARVGRKPRKAYVATSGRPFSGADVRGWFAELGHPIPDRGRLHREFIDVYAEAH